MFNMLTRKKGTISPYGNPLTRQCKNLLGTGCKFGLGSDLGECQEKLANKLEESFPTKTFFDNSFQILVLAKTFL